MSFQKKNVLVWGVIVAVLCGIAFLASSMFASAQEGETNANGDETTLEVQADGDAELSATKIKMYRLYNSFTGEHFYTKDASEKANLVKIGWTDEGIGWVAPSTSKYPVYRLNNPFSADGDHHYTMDSKEKDSLVKAGWKYEGIGWYSLAKTDAGAIPLLRQYNPYASSGSHNYTTSSTEQASLVKAGWKAEGVGWYGYDKTTPTDGSDSGTDGGSGSKTGGAIDFSKAKVDTASKVYKAAQWQPSVSITGLTKNTDYTVTYGANKNVGNGTITIKGKGKYTGSKTYTFKITQRVITAVTWGTSTWTYDGNNHVPTATAKGVLSADVKNFKVSVSGAQKKAGTFTAKATSVSNSNYKLKQNFTKSCTINKKEVTVSNIIAEDKQWDGGTEATLEFDQVKFNGKCGNDDLKVASATGVFESIQASDDPINVSISDIVLGGNDVGNYKLAAKGNQTSTTAKIFIAADATVTFDTQSHGNANFKKQTKDGYVVEPTASEYGTATGLKLEGWYTDSACKGERVSFDAKSINEDTTLYANWVPASEADTYWIGPSKQTIAESDAATTNVNYYAAAWNVKKSAAEIEADVATMKEENGSGSVTNQYKEFMNNDDYHLYVKWKGTTVDGSGQAQSENEYLEFRIIEVGSHDGDSSTLTFQSAYILPESKAMDADSASQGGWASSDMRSYLNGSGFTSLITKNLTSKILPVPKVSTKGGGNEYDVTDSVTDNFWIASLVEITGTTETGYSKEGKQYYYYSTKKVDSVGANPAFNRLTRAGYKSSDCNGSEGSWWTRSPYIKTDGKYCRLVGAKDGLVKNMFADQLYGVLPCFCF